MGKQGEQDNAQEPTQQADADVGVVTPVAPDVTPGQPGQSEGGAAPGQFTSVNRDELPPELQGVYDNMHRDYTQKTMDVAEQRRVLDRQSELVQIGQFALQHPEISQQLHRAASGQPAVQQQPQQQQPATEVVPDPETDPQGFFRYTVRTEVRDVVGEQLAPLLEQFQGVSTHLSRSQTNTEYQQLLQKHPWAAKVGADVLNMTRHRYQTPEGASMTMEQALYMLSGENPLLYFGQQTGQGVPTQDPTTMQQVPSAAGGETGKKGTPPVEMPGSTGGSSPAELPPPEGFKKLQKSVKELGESGQLGLKAAISRASAKLLDRR